MRPYILILLAAIVLIRCGSKEKEDPQPTNSLVATWTAVSQESEITSGGKPFVQALIDAFGDEAWAIQMNDISLEAHDMADTMYPTEMEIKNDGTFTAQGASGKWTLSDDKKVITMTLDNTDYKKMTGTITKLSDADLWIEVKVRVTDDLLGMIPTYDYHSSLKFTKKK